MISIATYRRQIFIQKNFIASSAIISLHNISNKSMYDKVYEKLIQVSGVYAIEETFLTKNQVKWLVVTNKHKNT